MGKDADVPCCDTCRMFAGEEHVEVVAPVAPLVAERAGIELSWRDRDGREHSLVPTGAVITVGRAKDNDIVIGDHALSKRQCRFRFEDGQVILEDMRSTCGTYLDGRKVQSAVVRDGSVVFFGNTQLRVTSTRVR